MITSLSAPCISCLCTCYNTNHIQSQCMTLLVGSQVRLIWTPRLPWCLQRKTKMMLLRSDGGAGGKHSRGVRVYIYMKEGVCVCFPESICAFSVGIMHLCYRISHFLFPHLDLHRGDTMWNEALEQLDFSLFFLTLTSWWCRGNWLGFMHGHPA